MVRAEADYPVPSAAEARAALGELCAAALEKLRGDELLRTSSRLDGNRWIYRGREGPSIEWDLPENGRIFVVGAGKATASLAKGLEEQLGSRITDGCIIVKYGHTEPLRYIRQVEAGHPIPDRNGVEGTRTILRLLDGLRPDDRVFVLITGGASSLLVAPAGAITLADKAAVTDLLLRSRASIEEINTVRQALSEVKGGRLLRRLQPAQSMTLLVSDVPSGELAKIGSGPTVPPPVLSGSNALQLLRDYDIVTKVPGSVLSHLEHGAETPHREAGFARHNAILLGDNKTLLGVVEEQAAARSIAVKLVDVAMRGDTHHAAETFAAAMKAHAAAGLSRPCLFVSMGETTLEVRGSGLGGRNQEFALVAARHISGVEGCAVLAAGTDGTDGPTPAAGGIVDWTTCERAGRLGLSADRALNDNDSYHLLDAVGDLYVTGPTGTNVMDLVLGLVA